MLHWCRDQDLVYPSCLGSAWSLVTNASQESPGINRNSWLEQLGDQQKLEERKQKRPSQEDRQKRTGLDERN